MIAVMIAVQAELVSRRAAALRTWLRCSPIKPSSAAAGGSCSSGLIPRPSSRRWKPDRITHLGLVEPLVARLVAHPT